MRRRATGQVTIGAKHANRPDEALARIGPAGPGRRGRERGFAGDTVAFIGRLEAMPLWRATDHVRAGGGETRRGISRRCRSAVIGHGAHALLAGGTLQAKLVQADRARVRCFSENGFLRRLGLLDPVADANQSMTLAALLSQAELDGETGRLLQLFDVIEPRDDLYGFLDLVAVKEVARLIGDGMSLAALLAGVAALRRGEADDHPLAHLRLARSPMGALALKVGTAFADLDGQLHLPLPDADGPSIDGLFEAAETAEANGDWAAAERFYRRCAELDTSDQTAAFNLANVLREQGRADEAAVCLRRVVALDPGYAEAWYNLADLAEGTVAQADLRRALAVDPDYADAHYNLADLLYRDAQYAAAADHWERYLALDPGSPWGKKARDGVTLCRQYLAQGH